MRKKIVHLNRSTRLSRLGAQERAAEWFTSIGGSFAVARPRGGSFVHTQKNKATEQQTKRCLSHLDDVTVHI